MPSISLLEKKEVAKRLNCTPRTIDNLVARNEGPPSVKIGRLRRFPEDGLEAWLRAKMDNQHQPAAAE